MKIKDKKVFEETMLKVRTEILRRLEKELATAREDDNKFIRVNVHDAEWIRTALTYHFTVESSKEDDHE